MKINQTLFFITLALSITLVASVKDKDKNSKGYKRYLADKERANAKKAAQPKPNTLEEKEATASKYFDFCTKKQWAGLKATFPAVQAMIAEKGITNVPKNFHDITKDQCRIATASASDDTKQGTYTFRIVYSNADGQKAYFPIVTTDFLNYVFLKDRTVSAQHNTLLTTPQQHHQVVDKHEESVNESQTETQDEQEEENVPVEEPVNEDMQELERLAAIASNGKSVHHPEEQDSTVEQPVNEDMQELERLADLVSKGKSIYHPEQDSQETNEEEEERLEQLRRIAAKHAIENQTYNPDSHNHIQKHNTQEISTQTDEETNEFDHLTNQNNDIQDHIVGSDDNTTGHKEPTGRPLLGGEHDIKLLEPIEEETDPMNNITPLFSDIDIDNSSKKHDLSAEESNYFHDSQHEEYDFFSKKHGNHSDKTRVNHLDNDTTDIDGTVVPKAQPEENYFNNKPQRLGSWSAPQTCNDEEKHNTMAYVSKMILSGKMLGLLPTTQNIMSCSHQIVAGTNFSVIIQINNDICEVVYNVDLENIVHDLKKSYAQREVPCVDMYARHLF